MNPLLPVLLPVVLVDVLVVGTLSVRQLQGKRTPRWAQALALLLCFALLVIAGIGLANTLHSA